MANFTASIVNAFVATPGQKVRTSGTQGRQRMFMSLYQAPASGTTPAIGDKVIWGRMPLGSVMLAHLGLLAWNTGTAACTINLGDSVSAAKHLAATPITATSTAVPSASTLIKPCVADVLINTFVLTAIKGIGALTVGDLVTGTGIPLASTIASVDIARASAVFTNLAGTPASATNPAVAVTSTGYPYRASDNSANADNAYVSTTDDATLISVVAGAQIANNQMIRLIMPYVMD